MSLDTLTPTITPDQQQELNELVNGGRAVACTFGHDDADVPPCTKPATRRYVCHCGQSETFCDEHYALVSMLASQSVYTACYTCWCPVVPREFYPI